ncbi:MAG: ATP synthase F1 subunit gamma [Armatimonadetes bacterium]|nr:ATP synthase F1 subunit gamma [Armatimonadota bacterium]
MATMRQIRTRIRVAGNIAQITRAMKMVAAARLKRAQDRVLAARPYVDRMTDVVSDLAAASDSFSHPLVEARPVQNTGVVVITADRGLCGSFNSGVMRRAAEFMETLDPDHARLMAVGRKGSAFFRRRGYPMGDVPEIKGGMAGYEDAIRLADLLRGSFASGELDEVHVVYARFVSAISQEPVVERLLPIEPPTASQGVWSARCIFEPDAATLADALLPRYLTTRVYYTLLESAASEHGARMTAMSSATDNATKMISALTLSLNRARQAAITKEISEIVSGAESLKA